MPPKDAKKKKADAAAPKKEAKAKAAPAAASAAAAPAPAAPVVDTSDKSRVIGDIPMGLMNHRVLTHYDETAGVAMSVHEIGNMQKHEIVPLTDAYAKRYTQLRTELNGKLYPKREYLLQLRRQLQSTSVDVDARRRNIERETLTDTEQILERLRSTESMRQSTIKHEVLKIEEQLQEIERVVRRVEQANVDDGFVSNGILLTSAHPGALPVETVRAPKAIGMVEVIHEFGDLLSKINQLATRPVTVQVNFPTDDFPRETSERLEVLSRCDKYMHALSIKDHMLWVALQEKNKAEDDLAENRRISQEYASELANWAELAQNLTQKNMLLQQDKDTMQRRMQDLERVLREHNIYYENT